MTVFTIGHSNHELDRFVALLELNSIEFVVDIRTVPKSRRNPQFHIESLGESMKDRGIGYRHLPRLDGWRKAESDSVNGAWRNEFFRGYADYAMGSEFAEGLAELRRMASGSTTTVICSEALWCRLLVPEDSVLHVASNGKTSVHELTDFALVDQRDQITDPPGPKA